MKRVAIIILMMTSFWTKKSTMKFEGEKEIRFDPKIIKSSWKPLRTLIQHNCETCYKVYLKIKKWQSSLKCSLFPSCFRVSASNCKVCNVKFLSNEFILLFFIPPSLRSGLIYFSSLTKMISGRLKDFSIILYVQNH